MISFWNLPIGSRFQYQRIGEKTPKIFVKTGTAEFSRENGRRHYLMFRPGPLVDHQMVEELVTKK